MKEFLRTLGSSMKILVASTLGFIVALSVNNAIMDYIKRDPKRSRTPPIVIAITLFIIALCITLAMAYFIPDRPHLSTLSSSSSSSTSPISFSEEERKDLFSNQQQKNMMVDSPEMLVQRRIAPLLH